eukprot:CAMPEP_0116938668 /NCGR_PEP_ID=MMETSP0467-20121206/32275_1 /TAXON_ID=283647 /ORGANISM="Mesodinium pulex, Strain SPMC105" /LENGTH=147 /DNA_ID=CAMNT_0004620795 /DNA_START=83 /DNA_END=526 /DNA_ORIENTATION=+
MSASSHSVITTNSLASQNTLNPKELTQLVQSIQQNYLDSIDSIQTELQMLLSFLRVKLAHYSSGSASIESRILSESLNIDYNHPVLKVFDFLTEILSNITDPYQFKTIFKYVFNIAVFLKFTVSTKETKSKVDILMKKMKFNEIWND